MAQTGFAPWIARPEREEDGVLLGDPDVVVLLGHRLGELVEPGPTGHGGGDADHPRIALGLLDQRVCEDRRVLRWRLGRRLLELLDPLGGVRLADRHDRLLRGLLAVDDRAGLGRVPLLHPDQAPLLGRLEALALDGLDMDDDRSAGVEPLPQRGAERDDVVAVDRAHVGEVELLEEESRRPVGLDRRLQLGPEPLDLAAEAERQLGEPLLGVRARLVEALVEPRALEVARDCADVRGNRHAVVVDDDHHRRLQASGMVERLVGDTAGERSVADHGDDVAVLADPLPHRLLEADRVADRGRGMPCAHDVVLGLEDRAERREALVLADRVEPVAPAREHLVGVGLVTDVPEDLVPRGVEQAVEGDRELTGAEVGAEVAADLADRVDDQLACLLRDLLELLVGEVLQIGGRVDRLEQPRLVLLRIALVLGHQVCRVWMKSVIRIKSSVRGAAPSSAARAFRCDSEANSRAFSSP